MKKTVSKKVSLPPGVSRQYKICVNTEKWFPNISSNDRALEELYSVTYNGITYKISDFRRTNHYRDDHIFAGQFSSASVSVRNLIEFLLGREITVHTSKSSDSNHPDYFMDDFLSEFLYQVKGSEEIESCQHFELRVWYMVDEKDIPTFEKDLAFVSNILRNCTFRLRNDLSEEEKEAEYN